VRAGRLRLRVVRSEATRLAACEVVPEGHCLVGCRRAATHAVLERCSFCPDALVELVLVLLVLLLVQIRNWFGFCSVLVTGTVLLAASWWLPDRGQSVLAYLVTWFLLMAAPRPVLELAAQRRRRGVRGTPDSDADQLARCTGVPAAVWIALFLSVTVGALLLGGHRLTLG
jgi:hypothetical protein